MKVLRNSMLALVAVGTTIFVVGCDQAIDASKSPSPPAAANGHPKVPMAPPGATAPTPGSTGAAPQ